MISWGLFLHFYQPPTQYPWVLDKITEECYRPLVRLFAGHPRAKATVNINGVLLELLATGGGRDVLRGFRALVEKGQWEIVGTSKYHTILPLLGRSEALRQIELQRKCLADHLGVSAVRGFFPPEMCFAPDILPWLKDADAEWVLVSGTSVTGTWPTDAVRRHPPTGLKILFRDEVISNRISFDRIPPARFFGDIEKIRPASGGDAYVITAMDAETFGHHIPEWDKKFLGAAFRSIDSRAASPGARTATLSEIADAFPAKDGEAPRSSSWSTTAKDLEKGIPYPLWKHPDNPIHKMQWAVLESALAQAELARSLEHLSEECGKFSRIARSVLDAAEHSCQFWWASRYPDTAGLDLIYKGLWLIEEAMINATRAVSAAPAHEPQKKQARDRFFAAAQETLKLRGKLAAVGD